jgi:hypothetical protein
VSPPKDIIAIDPGTTESGVVLMADGAVQASFTVPNEKVFTLLQMEPLDSLVAIEWIEGMGMAVGKETFLTCRWIGRFQQACHVPEAVRFVTRREVKLHLCGSMKAKDANIRQSLIDRFGPGKEAAIGKKANPGPLFGVSGHAWQALAVAVTALETT